MRRKVVVLSVILSMLMTMAIPYRSEVFAQNDAQNKLLSEEVMDTVWLGDSQSEQIHAFKHENSVAGIDTKAEPEYKGTGGLLTGGGIGDGLTYRYIRPSATEISGGYVQFTLEADPYSQNYLTIQLNGTQQDRGDLFVKGPDGSTSILKPANGTEVPELDNGYQKGAPFLGRYYYATYIIPSALVDNRTGKVTLSVSSTGVYDAYGKGEQTKQTQNSKFLYSASTHTEPYFELHRDIPYGRIPEGQPAKPKASATVVTDSVYDVEISGDVKEADLISPIQSLEAVASSASDSVTTSAKSDLAVTPDTTQTVNSVTYDAYGLLLHQTLTILDEVKSWQLYGPTYERIKTPNNAFLEGAMVTRLSKNEPVHPEYSKEQWAKAYTSRAINYQNWSPMIGVEIFANAYMNEWSGADYHSDEMLDRIFKLMDFYTRAQDSIGGWCVPTSGSIAYQWIGADLNGTGIRGKGEKKPLLRNGTDGMMSGFIRVYNYIMNGSNEQAKERLNEYLDETIDNNMTGQKSVTRRMAYIEMFGKLNIYYMDTNSEQDFYDPASRAGTVNQDNGFSYATNRAITLLIQSMERSKVDQSSIMLTDKYKAFIPPNDDRDYDMIKYKFQEMVDGEKWFSSDNNQVLEAGASHGGFAGDYGSLMLTWLDTYAELTEGDDKVHNLITNAALGAVKSFDYYLNDAVAADGTIQLVNENVASSRKNTYGLFTQYQILPYLALKVGSEGAIRRGIRYVEDNRVFAYDAIQDNLKTNTPHVYTQLVELQQTMKSFNAFAELARQQRSGQNGYYFPMEKQHSDFAFADIDSQAVVFKNKGERGYVTFNWRRENWKYNDFTRIHLTTDKVDRIANVKATHQGDMYVYEDDTANYRHDGVLGKKYRHIRYDGLNQVRYGNYLIGMNMSSDDPAVGQKGKVYELETHGVTKARDLMTGKEYRVASGETLHIKVEPRQTVVLEILKESSKLATAKAVYKAGDNIIRIDRTLVKAGDSFTATAPMLEGYELTDEKTKKIKISTKSNKNIIIFHYKANEAPIFNPPVKEAKSGWQVANLGGASGEAQLDQDGNPTAISTKGVASKHNGVTYLYRKIIGDGSVTMKVDGFDRIANPETYASVMMMPRLNYDDVNVQFRLFSNGDGVLLTHRSKEDETQKGSWTLDQNFKAAPLFIRLERKRDTFYTSYSKDGKNWTYATKSSYTVAMGKEIYAGIALTCLDDDNNTNRVRVSNVDLDGQSVLTDQKTGMPLQLDTLAKDLEQDPISYRIYGLPEGASLDEATRQITWTPAMPGSYAFTVTATDPFHRIPVENFISVEVNPAVGEPYKPPQINLMDQSVKVGDEVSFNLRAADINPTIVDTNLDEKSGYEVKDGRFTWSPKAEQEGVYYIAFKYTLPDGIVTKVVKISVNS